MRMRPSFNGGSCLYFTEGCWYSARPVGSGRVAEVLDDRQRVRVISTVAGEKCAHIIRHTHQGRHICTGTWEVALPTIADVCIFLGEPRHGNPRGWVNRVSGQERKLSVLASFREGNLNPQWSLWYVPAFGSCYRITSVDQIDWSNMPRERQ